jgi:LCP family protein required for cell wall assembly
LKRNDGLSPRIAAKAVLAIVGIAAALAIAYIGAQWLENRSRAPEARGDYRQRYAYDDLVEIDGVQYRKRGSLTTILLMGIDRDSGTVSTGYRNGGQADFLRLLVIDAAQKRVTQVPIDRDTMTPITILGVLGDESGVRTAQISLSHGFGDGGDQSCELTAKAVSNLLMGAPVDMYLAMDMDGISVLNDSVGGVTVTLEDDFSSLDPAMQPGTTLTLMGEQAELFVRSRMSIGVGDNASRMKRQQTYIAQLSDKVDQLIEGDRNFIGELYDALDGYTVTNISRGRLINEAWTSREYERALVELPGEHEVAADGFMQFHIDENALKQIVLNLFYDEVALAS